jgi:hypothetical protein
MLKRRKGTENDVNETFSSRCPSFSNEEAIDGHQLSYNKVSSQDVSILPYRTNTNDTCFLCGKFWYSRELQYCCVFWVSSRLMQFCRCCGKFVMQFLCTKSIKRNIFDIKL